MLCSTCCIAVLSLQILHEVPGYCCNLQAACLQVLDTESTRCRSMRRAF